MSVAATTLELETPHGRARVHLYPCERPRAALVLGHGAGGGVTARDLVAATEAAGAESVSVALVEQPYRVAGRRSPAPARQLDAAWIAIVDQLRAGDLAGLPIVVGGRSSGGRVACRTATATGAAGVLCLAFPLQPPRRSQGEVPPSRLDELDAVPCPGAGRAGGTRPFRDPAGLAEPHGGRGERRPQPPHGPRRGRCRGRRLAPRAVCRGLTRGD